MNTWLTPGHNQPSMGYHVSRLLLDLSRFLLVPCMHHHPSRMSSILLLSPPTHRERHSQEADPMEHSPRGAPVLIISEPQIRAVLKQHGHHIPPAPPCNGHERCPSAKVTRVDRSSILEQHPRREILSTLGRNVQCRRTRIHIRKVNVSWLQPPANLQCETGVLTRRGGVQTEHCMQSGPRHPAVRWPATCGVAYPPNLDDSPIVSPDPDGSLGSGSSRASIPQTPFSPARPPARVPTTPRLPQYQLAHDDARTACGFSRHGYWPPTRL